MQWWDERRIGNGQGLRWRIGPLRLELSRSRAEWRLAWHGQPTDEPAEESDEATVEPLAAGGEPPAGATVERYVVHATAPGARLRPQTADRAVVIRPREPFVLPSREETLLFVSSPLWVAVQVEPEFRTLRELPAQRPSDTWFGPSTMVGELAYDSRTHGELELERLLHRPHRIVTPLRIHNRADSPLTLERVSLPVPLLSVFTARDGRLWSEAVTLEREEDGELAALRIDKGPPPQVGRAELLGGPRRTAERHMLFRAFGGLFD